MKFRTLIAGAFASLLAFQVATADTINVSSSSLMFPLTVFDTTAGPLSVTFTPSADPNHTFLNFFAFVISGPSTNFGTLNPICGFPCVADVIYFPDTGGSIPLHLPVADSATLSVTAEFGLVGNKIPGGDCDNFTTFCVTTSVALSGSGTNFLPAPPPDSSTPLPATLPLFATGFGALGLLGWRRKRKANRSDCVRCN